MKEMAGCCCKVASFFTAFMVFTTLVTSQTSNSSWLTLTGNAPAIVAKGGFSGVYPDSSQEAYSYANFIGSPNTILWCDVQLTKDGVGICLPNILLDNCTSIQTIYPNEKKRYTVNGENLSGWFPVDYDFQSLTEVYVVQTDLSRSDKFNANAYPIVVVEDLLKVINAPSPLWLNIQHDSFYREHNLSMKNFLLAVSKRVPVNYVSSPEVAFLKSIVANFNKSKTKLVFRLLDEDITEPTTNQTYGSLLKNLTFIKTFASGILIHKHFIWPITTDLYLQPYTSVVLDAHKEGLEVFAADFANDDISFSYNYSYDPLAEYLNFVDNGIFSVDGVLTDYPITALEAIGCFAHIKRNDSDHGGKPIVISNNGASGIYPDCTDLAYEQAVADGADYIDCNVQVTKDGTLLCMSSINLMDSTTVAKSPFSSRSTLMPGIQSTPGIFTFNLTWDEIQKNLKPAIRNPEIKYGLLRNPRYKNAGNFMTLPDFLAYAKGTPLSGILISIEYAAFLAKDLGYSITDEVISALESAGYNNQTAQEVMIQSTNSSVLNKFKQRTNYKFVYRVDKSIANADALSLSDIKMFASSVAVSIDSVYPSSQEFIMTQTDVVNILQSAGFSVFVHVLRNEYESQPWDFLSDPTVEINSLFQEIGVDGIITEFPGTVTRYRRNTCLNLGDQMPNYILPVRGGDLLSVLSPPVLPPALPPLPYLHDGDVVEPPLPPVSPNRSGDVPPSPQPSAGQPQCLQASIMLYCTIIMLLLLHI